MRTFESLTRLSKAAFKRLTGVSRETFDLMAEVVKQAVETRQRNGGPRFRLKSEDMVLLALTYWREYRTYFHIASDQGLSESQCFRIVKLVEEALIKDRRFHLKGKDELLKEKETGTYVIVDVSESPMERPQKKDARTDKNTSIQAKRSAIR